MIPKPLAARTASAAAASLLALLMLVACDDDPVEVVEPPDPDPQVTEIFSGTVEQLGLSIHLFTIGGLNNTEVEITELAPLETLTLGLGVGTSTDGGETCALLAQDRSVRLGETLLIQNLAEGEYCVTVFDVGNIFPDQVVEYTIEVLHP
ncbi:MAG: hypothetical protein DWQ30_17265 [Acidobacteria bacterium]|nr:MAG: hypothetical protein DWQ30_17265 [Acidobacteriota bacterium]